MNENELQRRIRLALGREPDAVLWRNNVGVASFFAERIQRVEYGLCKGSSDLIGLVSLVVTPDMVGRTLGRFTAIEIKKPGGRSTQEQRLFRDLVLKLGGHAEIVNGEQGATEALKKAREL